jgi:type I restriction enzyme S subunit
MTALLTANMALMAAAPEGIATLRELILDLAIRGRLVEQDPSNESGADLLAKCRHERASAMARGAIKKEKSPSEVSDDEVPFRLPSGWAWCRVTDTGDYINGLAFKPGDWADTGRPIIRIQNLSGRSFDFNRTAKEVDESVVVRRGDILVSWSATLDAFVWQGDEGVLNQHIFRVEPGHAVDRRFLFWLMKWVIRSLANSDHSHGLVMAHINRGPFLAHPVGLPPIKEQAQIAGRIDELMALCDRLEARQQDAEAAHAQLVQTLLDSLTQASDADDFPSAWLRVEHEFDGLFTTAASVESLRRASIQLGIRGLLCATIPSDGHAAALINSISATRTQAWNAGLAPKPKPFAPLAERECPYGIPSGWSWVRLGQLGVAATGSTPATSQTDAFDGPTPFIGPGQITPGGVISSGEKSLSDIGLASSTIAQPGDLLMVCIGGSIGKCAIADRMLAFNQQINSLSVLEANPHFVFLVMSSPEFQQAVLTLATGSATPIINRSKWEEIPVPLPPLAAQHRIVAKVTELLAICDQLKARIAAARAKHAQLAEALVAQAVAA